MSAESPSPSSSAPPMSAESVVLTDLRPVVAICQEAGIPVDPGVHRCAMLAASAHQDRFTSRSADSPAVNRSTFLWALARTDTAVGDALERHGASAGDLAKVLGINADPPPPTGTFGLGDDLVRALRT